MKKRFLIAIFASLALMTAACSAEKEPDKSLAANETEKNEDVAAAKEKTEKEATELEAKIKAEKEAAEKEAKEAAEKEAAEKAAAEAGEVVNNAQNYMDHVPLITEEVLTLSDTSFNYINENPDLFPAMTDAAIDKAIKLTDNEITSKHLNKNVTPYLDKMVNLAGDVIQIEEDTLEDGTPISIILIEDMDFNAIYAVGYFSTDILEGDFVDVWGLPLGAYHYENVDGGTTLAQALAISHIE